MLLSFQDRLRIPWRGGAKQVAFGSISPLFILPIVISIAAINVYTFTVICLACTLMMCYAFNYVIRRSFRTRFFNMWIIASLIYLVLLFEITVPLLEVLPEENCALALFSLASFICFYQTYKRATSGYLTQSSSNENEMAGPNEEACTNLDATPTVLFLEKNAEGIQHGDGINKPNICSICCKWVPSHAAHCKVCGACIKRYDHHSYWLNCCIGESNHRYYIFGLIFGILALLLGADLTLTAVCHPYLATNILGVQILLPDDCSEVFDMYELSVAFIIAFYALIMAAYKIIILLRQVYCILQGITLHECKRGPRGTNNSFKYGWKSLNS